ncbi:DUF167 family protein [Mesorhizobium sp. J428]|uniref:DUF167 family protein n=1 Tax=Mesorhizobium sp. J428 TaxID=2898440 RepID=UPI0035B0CCD5
MERVVRLSAGRIDIRVRLTPKSSADRIEGVAAASDGSTHLAARVRAVPEKGAANAALERLVAEWLGVPGRTVSVTGGATSRIKTVSVAGDAALLSKRVEERLAGG